MACLSQDYRNNYNTNFNSILNTLNASHCVSPLGHSRGEPLDVKAWKHLHVVLWQQASRAYEDGEYKEALSWYNYSLGLFPFEGGGGRGKDGNMAKLQV